MTLEVLEELRQTGQFKKSKNRLRRAGEQKLLAFRIGPLLQTDQEAEAG